jgi:hypothetical protein
LSRSSPIFRSRVCLSLQLRGDRQRLSKNQTRLYVTCEDGFLERLRVSSIYKKGLPLPLQLTISIEQSHYILSSKSNRFGPRSSQTAFLVSLNNQYAAFHYSFHHLDGPRRICICPSRWWLRRSVQWTFRLLHWRVVHRTWDYTTSRQHLC